jgi:hypothetical protein
MKVRVKILPFVASSVDTSIAGNYEKATHFSGQTAPSECKQFEEGHTRRATLCVELDLQIWAECYIISSKSSVSCLITPRNKYETGNADAYLWGGTIIIFPVY